MREMKLGLAKNRSLNLGLSVGMLALASACTVGSDPGQTLGLNEAVECPEGYVGYSFGERPIDLRSDYYQWVSGADASVPKLNRPTITIESVSCASLNAADRTRLEVQCNGQQLCEFPSEAVCPSTGVTLEWTCGNSETVESAQFFSGDGFEINCATESDYESAKRDLEVRNSTVCVPRHCTGDTVRDSSLNCVSRPRAIVSNWRYGTLGFGSDKLVRLEQVDRVFGRNPGSTLILPDTLYNVRGEPNVANINGETISNARMTLWVADQYVPRGAQAAWDKKNSLKAFPWNYDGSVYAFRCTLGQVDWNQNTPFNKQFEASPECFNEDRAMRELERRTGLSDPLENYEKVSGLLRKSFDIEGFTIVVPPEDVKDKKTVPADHCAPNPPEFFFDNELRNYDMIAYYEQRDISRITEDLSSPILPQRVDVSRLGRVTTIGSKELELGAHAVEVTNHPVNSPSVPMQYTFFVDNDNYNSPYYLGGLNKDKPAVRASLYMWPSDGDRTAADWPKVGDVRIPLDRLDPRGTTVTGELRLPASVRSQFYNKNSKLYVPQNEAGSGTRSFELVACLDVQHSTGRFDGRFFRGPKVTPRRLGTAYAATDRIALRGLSTLPEPIQRQEGNNTVSTIPEPTGNDYALIVDNGLFVDSFTPYSPSESKSGIYPGRGCVFSKMPLVITADWFERPLTSIGGQSFNGETNNVSSGNDVMDGAQENGTQVTCTGDGEKNCTETMQSGMGSEGEITRSFYTTTTNTHREEGKSVRSEINIEAFGYQVAQPDMSDEEPPAGENSNMWPSEFAPKRGITFKVTPPWDALVTSLNSTLRFSSSTLEVEWEKGRYAGRSGLGLVMGYKQRWTVGPVPVLAIASVSVGVSVEAALALDFAPEEGKEYPCSNSSSDCYQRVSTAKSLQDAQDHCVELGGRLGELSSDAEAAGVIGAIPADNTSLHWLGAQAAYGYQVPDCAVSWVERSCRGGSRTSLRWLSTDGQFATADGSAALSFSNSAISAVKAGTLYSSVPTESGLVFSRDGSEAKVLTAAITDKRPFVCVFDYADSTTYFGMGISINGTAAAGLGLSACVPNDDPGVCITGTLNIVASGVELKWENNHHWLARSGSVFGRRGSTGLSMPWKLQVLSGSVEATATLGVLSTSWEIASWDGFVLREGEVFNFTTPVLVNF